MKTTERDVGKMHIIEDDRELRCPLTNEKCLTDRCAMSVFTEDRNGTNVYCGLVATNKNIGWNETGGLSLRAPWTKSITREKDE